MTLCQIQLRHRLNKSYERDLIMTISLNDYRAVIRSAALACEGEYNMYGESDANELMAKLAKPISKKCGSPL